MVMLAQHKDYLIGRMQDQISEYMRLEDMTRKFIVDIESCRCSSNNDLVVINERLLEHIAECKKICETSLLEIAKLYDPIP